MNITQLLKIAVDNKVSDVHLTDNLPPVMRINGRLITFNEYKLEHNSIIESLREIIPDQYINEFREKWEIDFAISLPYIGRFRCNLFKQNNGVSAVLRIISQEIISLDILGLTKTVRSIADLSHGLVLISGSAGSGKSSTLAAIINYINEHYAKHIITIEDPIEYIHTSKKSLINQRELYRDTQSFHLALRSALREDPNIILVGELRDLETMRLALTAAETGHLIFATLHTVSAAKSINRIIDLFPQGDKQLICAMLSESLRVVISQVLLNRIVGGRVAAFEIMFSTAAIRNLIREDKVSQIYSVIQTNAGMGMQTLDQHLQSLLMSDVISSDVAKGASVNKELFC